MWVLQIHLIRLAYYGCLELAEGPVQNFPAVMKYRDEYRDGQNDQNAAMNGYHDDRNVAMNGYRDDQNVAMIGCHDDRNVAMGEYHGDQNDHSEFQARYHDENHGNRCKDPMSHSLKCLGCDLSSHQQFRPMASLAHRDRIFILEVNS